MVKMSEWRTKHGYSFKYGEADKRYTIRNINRKKDHEGQVVHAREFLIPGIKKAEPLDAYGWITLTTRVSTLAGVIYLIASKVTGI